MGLINTLSKQAKDIASSGKKYKDAAKNVRRVFKEDSKPSVIVSDNISRDEFYNRYTNLRIISVVTMALSIISLFMAPFSETAIRLLFTLSASTWFGMLYYRYAYRMWVARQGWISWETISKEITLKQNDFLNELKINPVEILPLPLSRKEGRKV